MGVQANRISRRTLLRGAGAALALPWLEAMATPAQAASAPPLPKRFAAMFMPNGVRTDMWTPDGEGRDFSLSPSLEPLASRRDDLLVLTQLWNQASNVGDGHYVKTSGFLTCTTINKSLGIDLNCNGVSLDQLIAEKTGQYTPLPSLELAMEPVSIGVDRNVGYTRVYGSHIAWKGPTMPLAREINPQLVYERLLRAARPHSAGQPRQRLLLDRVLGDARQLRDRVGVGDRQRLDEYLQSVRSLEERLDRAAAAGGNAWSPLMSIVDTDAPGDAPNGHAERVRMMLDMIVLAFRSDTTRVSTFMFGNAVSGQNFSFLEGVTGSHHDTSHHQNDAEKLRQYQLINRWHVEQYAYLLNQLSAAREGDGSVLDNSVILFGSGLRDGNSHSPRNLPILVGGRAGGRLATGQHRIYSRDTPLANLYLSLLDALDIPAERFADSTERLAGVLVS
ncbi:MAG: DUF1552 domain-containing protein [Planctomycetales bacterium]|nr:DUF1552 domain-containing protein [Planctomycetales bacterium]